MKEIKNFISQCGNKNFYPVYKGQSDKSWALTPTIGRLFNTMNNNIKHNSWRGFENALLDDLKDKNSFSHQNIISIITINILSKDKKNLKNNYLTYKLKLDIGINNSIIK